VVLKDNICTAFSRTTCSSRILENFRSPYNATVVDRIETAGGVIIAKSNLDEFAMGSSTENSAFGPVRNPWNLDHVPGGSSGGSAAAVIARIAHLGFGSDTGGSIRQPAALCGVAGMKPTYGRVSRYGLVAYGSSLDQIGPFARCVDDVALSLGVISGADPLDSTCVPHAVGDYHANLSDEAIEQFRSRPLRVGVPLEYFGEGLDPDVRGSVKEAVEVLRRAGAQTIELSLPHSPYAVAVYYMTATAEASSNLARYDGVHYGHRTAKPRDLVHLYSASRSEGFGPEVKRRIMLGTYALSAGYYDAYYMKALKVRRLIREDFDKAFAQCDVVLSPTSPTPAFRMGEKAADPLQMYLADIYTIAANLAGLPGISIPCGFSRDGLPIGLQLVGPVFGETAVLQAAKLFERETDWHTRTPQI
jgi:aspartyl-tRNA(Asn)/glutamyl-tRNA(Gln) amidotransferase subunit A